MDTKTLIIHKPEWRCHHGKNSARPVHKGGPGRGRSVGVGGRPVCRRSGPAALITKSTLETWVRAAKAGKLGNIGKNRRLLTEVEIESARTVTDRPNGATDVQLNGASKGTV